VAAEQAEVIGEIDLSPGSVVALSALVTAEVMPAIHQVVKRE
jgi:ribose/xylose/arabinose/galactoside ABC-type transport system permease subunit